MAKRLSDSHISSTNWEKITNSTANTYSSTAAPLNPFEIKDVLSINQAMIIDLTGYTHNSVADSKPNRFGVGKENRIAIEFDVRKESKIVPFKVLDFVKDYN